MDFYFPMGQLISHRILKFPMGKLISHRILKFPIGHFKIRWDIRIFPWENKEIKKSHLNLKYPMGFRNIPWENLISHGNLHFWSSLSHLPGVNR